MGTDIRQIYRSAWIFARACPLLFLVPVIVEAAQHVVELNAGMYLGEAGARAAEQDPLRLRFGFAKTLAILLPTYWFTRFVLFGHDPARARSVEWPAIGLWLVIFALSAADMAWSLFGPPLSDLLGLQGTSATSFAIAEGVLTQIVAIYLSVWITAWPLGNARLGPIRSVRIMHGSFWYTVGLMIAGVLPLMAVHYAIAIVAVVWAPPVLDWALMAADAILVGYLALTLTGASIYAARHAADRKGVDLVPEEDLRPAAQAA